MLNVFTDIKSLLKVGRISIDNWVFKLHYKVTVIILIVFSIVVNSRQFFGDPIDCSLGAGDLNNYIDTYCWFNSYSLVDKEGHVYTEVQKFYKTNNRNQDHSKIYPLNINDYFRVKQTYYQWIGFVLLLQAAFFFAPRFLWKNLFEEGRVRELVDGLQSHIQNEDDFEKKQQKIIEYVMRNKGHHLMYAVKFFFCEVLNFMNVILQIWITDWFLGHAFLNYGIQWLWYDVDSDKDSIVHPSYRYFPKETLCDVYSGSSGGGQNNFHQARCILPIQIINEKIYLFLWFYFIAIAVITGLFLVYRVIIMVSSKARYYLFKRRAWATDEKYLKTFIEDFDVGDWFILYQMMKNMDPFIFSQLMKNIYSKVMKKPSTVESNQELLGVYSPNDNEAYDTEEKLNNKGLLKGYFSRSKVSP